MWFMRKKSYFPITGINCPEIRKWIFDNCKSPIQIVNHYEVDGSPIVVYFTDEVESVWFKFLFAGKTADQIAEQAKDPLGERRRALIAGNLRKMYK